MTLLQQGYITQLLVKWNNGNEAARDELISLVESELRQIANRYLYKERPNHSLQATELINEAFIKLIEQRNVHWQNRAHFFGIAAEVMRRILLDYARTRHAAKRDGNWHRISLDKAIGLFEARDRDLIALDDALNNLAAIDPQKSKIIELRFFGGLSIEETAQILQVSCDTVKAEWRVTRARLYREISRKERGRLVAIQHKERDVG
jgi:RNA polymerase sigma factor (TIGR02999 family)